MEKFLSIKNMYHRKKMKKQKKMKMKALKKRRRGGSVDITISIATPAVRSLLNDDNNILCEVLSRLPVKSLMQFKCVCKGWQSLIQQDPYFIGLHLSRSKTRPNLLLSIISSTNYRQGIEYCLSANLFDDRVAVSSQKNWLDRGYNMKGPVNGLVCLFNARRVEPFAVSVCNLSTQEETPWIKKTIVEQGMKLGNGLRVHHNTPTYGFGFDPATKEHKVICVCKTFEIDDGSREVKSIVTVCKVLTVGDNSWRSIDEVPPYDLTGISVYANGSIYWRMAMVYDDDDEAMKVSEFIVAFDVGSEKFRVFPVPNFILNQPPKCDSTFLQCDAFLEVDDHPAILHRMDSHTIKLWILVDADDHKEEKVTTNNGCNNCIEETITLPFCWGPNTRLYVQAVAGTDQIIVLSKTWYRSSFQSSFHLYDRKKKTFKKVEISGISVSSLNNCWSIKTFVESLLPV